jgi:hypothetical protein
MILGNIKGEFKNAQFEILETTMLKILQISESLK